ncbi:MAG: DUF2177 family protein [Acholeplasmataceae bacterium]|jgi:uncharacterized membrane protein|nr:DUF2177 family protein [Acholeplasmataceae bacterium]
MLPFLKLYGIAFIFFLIIDLIWLGFIAKNLYQKQLGHLMADQVNWVAAIIFYLLFIVGLVYFAILPAVNDGQWVRALLLGAFFGFITYATYDLTNLATLKDWPIQITIIDLAWGTFLGASISTLTYFTNNLLS